MPLSMIPNSSKYGTPLIIPLLFVMGMLIYSIASIKIYPSLNETQLEVLNASAKKEVVSDIPKIQANVLRVCYPGLLGIRTKLHSRGEE
jgi:hypothetical protein